MTEQQQIETIQELCDAISATRKQLERMDKVIPGFYDCALVNSYDHLEMLSVNYCAQLTGINEEALSWFICDCSFGERPKTASHPATGYTKIINSVEAFVEFENHLKEH